MGLKTEDVVFGADAKRDANKTFVITEMPVMKLEKWALRALLALVRSGADVPDEMLSGGVTALISVPVRSLALLRPEDAEPLLDEMLRCVAVRPDPRKNSAFVRPLQEDDIEEIDTLLQLRSRVIELHLGFSPADALQRLKRIIASARQVSSSTPPSGGSAAP